MKNALALAFGFAALIAMAARAESPAPIATATAPCAYALDIPGDPPPSAEIPGRFVIARRGAPPPCAISLDADASEAERYAAAELRDFTARMTGVTLPIGEPAAGQRAIVLSKSAKDLPIEAFRLTAGGDRLLIEASGGNGILYGVYELLERHGGCRWYSSWCERVPELEVFSVPDDLADEQRPAFKLREPYWRDVKMNPDFACRNRINGSLHMKLDAKHGGMPYASGTGPLHFCHTFTKLCPPSLYFDEHPEYFSEVNGKRLKERTQLCLTNPDVLRIVTSNVLANIRKDPGKTFYGVSQNDYGNYCTCRKCREADKREGAHSGTIIAFVNKVAEAVEKEFPDVKIETLAYTYSRKPPKHVRPRANVLPCLCTMEVDHAHAVGRSRHPETVAFGKDLKAWGSMSDELFIYDYVVDFSHYTAPFANVLSFQDNLRAYRDNNVKHIFAQGANETLHAEFSELKAWLLAKWMWNPDLPREELLQDFFNGFYGKAAPYVRTYFDALHSFYHDPRQNLHTYHDVVNDVIPDEFYERAQLIWDEAEKAVADEPETIRRNVRIARFPVHYAQFMRGNGCSPFVACVARDIAPFEAQARRNRDLARKLLELEKYAGRINVAESGRAIKARQACMEAWAKGAVALPAASDTTIVEDKDLHLWFPDQRGVRVEDPGAGDGSAIKVNPGSGIETVALFLRRVAFDKGAKYRLSARIRFDRRDDAIGGVFRAGIYETAKWPFKAVTKPLMTTLADVGDGYRWYEVAVWRPEEWQAFILAQNFDGKHVKRSTSNDGVYIDCVKIERVE